MVRCDAAGATHELVAAGREMGLRYSIGFPITEPLREAVLGLEAWRRLPAVEADDTLRDRAWDAELPTAAIPAGWPDGSRLVAQPHPARSTPSPTSTGTASSSC